MKRQDGARGAIATSRGGEFLRRAAPQANDGSGNRRQRLWKWWLLNGRLLALLHSRGKEGWRY